MILYQVIKTAVNIHYNHISTSHEERLFGTASLVQGIVSTDYHWEICTFQWTIQYQVEELANPGNIVPT